MSAPLTVLQLSSIHKIWTMGKSQNKNKMIMNIKKLCTKIWTEQESLTGATSRQQAKKQLPIKEEKSAGAKETVIAARNEKQERY